MELLTGFYSRDDKIQLHFWYDTFFPFLSIIHLCKWDFYILINNMKERPILMTFAQQQSSVETCTVALSCDMFRLISLIKVFSHPVNTVI